MHGGVPLDEPRAGAKVLGLLANPLHVRIVQAHVDGHLRLAELHEKAEWPARTTLRAAVGTLGDHGILDRREVSRMPFGTATELTPAGEEVLFVADVVERWLARGPQGPVPIDSPGAQAALKALAAGWSSTMVRELAHEPASLTELDRRIAEMSYPSLERRLLSMRSTRQVAPLPSEGRGRPFGVTEWLRHSVAPLSAAGRWERRHMREECAAITAAEIEAAFLLAIPLVPLPESASGKCLLSAAADNGGGTMTEADLAGVTVEVERGTVTSCVPELRQSISTWALGSPTAWLDAVIEGRLERLRFGGVCPQLGADLAHGLHVALFASD